MKQLLVDILVKKIQNAEINPITNEPYKLDDIKIAEYRTAVEEQLSA